MPDRVCGECGGGFYQHTGRPGARCPKCAKKDRYGRRHQTLRAATIESAYYQPCSRCGKAMLPGQDLHLDHLDGGDADEYMPGLFSHAACNIRAANYRVARSGRPVIVPPNLSQLDFYGEEYRRIVESRPHHEWFPGDPVPPISHWDGCDCLSRAETQGYWTSRCWGQGARTP